MPKYTPEYENKCLNKYREQKGIFDPRSPQSSLAVRTANMLVGFTNELGDDPDKVVNYNKCRSYANAITSIAKHTADEDQFKAYLKNLQGLKDFLDKKDQNGVTMLSKLREYADDEEDALERGLGHLSDALELGLGLGSAEEEIDEEAEHKSEDSEPLIKNKDEVSEKSRNNILAENDEELQVEPPPVQPRFKASALIESIQTRQDPYRVDQRTGQKELNTDWVTMIMAARSLADSKRGDASRLESTRISVAELKERANELKQDPVYRDFLKRIKASPMLTEHVVKLGKDGHGGGLDDELMQYITVNRKKPNSEHMDRYRPTAQQQIELMQFRLKELNDMNPASHEDEMRLREEKKICVASIFAARESVGARRGAPLRMDSRLKEKPDPDAFADNFRDAKDALSKMSDDVVDGLISRAVEGHGGKMKEEFTAAKELVKPKSDEGPVASM